MGSIRNEDVHRLIIQKQRGHVTTWTLRQSDQVPNKKKKTHITNKQTEDN